MENRSRLIRTSFVSSACSQVGLRKKQTLIFSINLTLNQHQKKDFFHGEVVEQIRLQGLEHVLHFTAVEGGKLLMRSYKYDSYKKKH